ncbi:MAG: YggS family pyridoxal phosphate-dependent enzyme [Tannerellaceae bacterium]|jgi:pyridoxal phosphate enzyme (YggS family)|nr:YggS family pyridoxal phosphate-dependent enzyme [Tannerellaceae bacterium]
MSIGAKIRQLKSLLPEEVRLVAVSKLHPPEAVMEAYEAGQRIFGESRAQELAAKHNLLPKDIEWHFIGPLQRNKIKDIAPFVHTIHSIDSPALLQEVNRQAAKHDRVIRVLLEIHIAMEENKHGFTPQSCRAFLSGEEAADYRNTRICGLMGMATFTDDKEQIRKEFHQLHDFFEELKSARFKGDEDFRELSMGMTNDYPIAIDEGSTLVRLGSYIFNHYKCNQT